MRIGYRQQKQNRVVWACFALLLFFVSLLGDPGIIREESNRHIYQVYCVGDSITYGNGLEEWEWSEASYPARLQQLLGPRYAVMNYGISGATLLDVPKKAYDSFGYLGLMRQQSPDIFVVMLGTNDSKKKNWDAALYRERYAALVDELKQIPTTRYVYLMAPPEAYAGEDGKVIYGIDNDVIRDEIREIVKEVAEESGEGWIDIYTALKDHPECFAQDGLHPNQAGYALLARIVGERVQSDQMRQLF